ncbi:winged helix-turn-helix domain-containing protein [Phyllobacterium sp. 21LDTY02-6]|jgi:DNA-binding transcriptional ArsR family regulator|uniref:ArsR/SmtB family transcription factor n=1 Tax=unclassified Phyllobacterium TaxID=2638441 RepID=UPI002021D441|nr:MULTISPECIES: winged helix-turn-helix domain-containing protein [unclassified Phyllobacterium]MCO4316462.1 winged helix-turn-helix domain-containing protein [Phyllobacterium sp. 21LDTY02-6]MCX8280736.1 winged helix-turn-helix domain-containing protein [Phyllobacterium sp. 0TCS1.6C]MCX8292687.1 winged helix-turn-helix domain-containing protein [Phyllobacterium sp. 0TCS1.6A]
MANTARFAEIAALAGDPGRASMLYGLMDGRALTASELAQLAGITAQTASSHLTRMTDAGLLTVEKQGRHRYHRLASAAVAQMIESIMQLAAPPAPARSVRTGPRDAALRAGRTCYDHLAGHLGVSIADSLARDGHLEFNGDAAEITASGLALLRNAGLDADAMAKRGRILCRPCLDWSERRPHLAGALGAALCSHCFDRGWVRRIEGTRAVSVTPNGRRQLRETFGVTLDAVEM